MYRIKEAFRIFWAVLFHKYYYFASAAELEVGGSRYCYCSDEAEVNLKFLYLAGLMSLKLAKGHGFDIKLVDDAGEEVI